MNILLIAPDMGNINSIPEIRAISGAHRTHVLNGTVTLQNIYDAVTNNQYSVIHFATHIRQDLLELDEIQLSAGESLDLNSATQLAKLGGAQLVVFNICLAARFATYMVRNGIPCVVYTTITIEDRTAWELPNAFYEQCRRTERDGHPLDFRAIFNKVDSGDGTYGMLCGEIYELSQIQKGLLPLTEKMDGMTAQLESTTMLATTMSGRLSSLEHQRNPYQPTWITYLSLLFFGILSVGVAVIAWELF